MVTMPPIPRRRDSLLRVELLLVNKEETVEVVLAAPADRVEVRTQCGLTTFASGLISVAIPNRLIAKAFRDRGGRNRQRKRRVAKG